MVCTNLTGRQFLQIEYIWVSGLFPQIMMCSNIAIDQTLDTGIYTICSCVYPGHLYNAMLWLIIPNFQARYFGLCPVMYVYAFCDSSIFP